MPDHLAVWLRAREQVPWREVVPHPTAPVSAIRDGYVSFAQSAAWRDQRRLSRLLAAYDDVRREVAADADLTPDRLARWNGIVRGVSAVEFRRAPAYAKHGRERYGLHSGTECRFHSCLAEASDPGTPVAARAARAYLDIAFFHPYDDGNARLGGLALQFVLLRGSVELDEVAPILTMVRRADDSAGAAGLALLVHGIAMATQRRWSRVHTAVAPLSHRWCGRSATRA